MTEHLGHCRIIVGLRPSNKKKSVLVWTTIGDGGVDVLGGGGGTVGGGGSATAGAAGTSYTGIALTVGSELE